MNDPALHLLLLVSDLCARHLYDAVLANPNDEEIRAEFEELAEAFEPVKSIYIGNQNSETKTASIPTDIEKYLLDIAPRLFPISLSQYDEAGRLLIRTSEMMSQAVADELDVRWPDIIVHAVAPIYQV